MINSKLLAVLALVFFMAGKAQAQDVPDLSSVLDDIDVSSFSDTGDIDSDLWASIDSMVDDANLNMDDTKAALAGLSVAKDNLKFFNFDIVDAMAEVIQEGKFSSEEVRNTIEAFDTLSDQGKYIVGKEEFDYVYKDEDSEEGREAKRLWDQLSQSDKDIIVNKMPVVTEDR